MVLQIRYIHMKIFHFSSTLLFGIVTNQEILKINSKNHAPNDQKAQLSYQKKKIFNTKVSRIQNEIFNDKFVSTKP